MPRRAGVLFPILSLLAAAAYGQTPDRGQRMETDYTIRGKLMFGTPHSPDQRIEVQLEKTGKQHVQTAYSDSVGNFEFRNLQPGTYNVCVSNLEGYEETCQAVEVYSTTGRVVSVNVFLSEKLNFKKHGSSFEGDEESDNIVDIKQLGRSLPRKAVDSYEKGVKESRKGNVPEATRLLEEAVRLSPDFYQARNNLGVIYQKTQRYRDAEREFRKAQEINPRAQQPSINLGSLFIQEADARKGEGDQVYGELLDQALDVLEAATKANPRSVMAHYYLGSAFYKSSFFDEAIHALRKATELDPKFNQSRLMLINVYTRQKQWDAALREITSFLSEFPGAGERPALEEMRTRITQGLTSPRK